MKNWYLVLLLLGLLGGLSAQISPNALGLRFSGSDEVESVGVEVSYQKALGDNNRLEADLGINNSSFIDLFRLAGFYHWVFPLEQGFSWYVGPGAGIGIIDYDAPVFVERDSDVFLILGGQAGIEYSFDQIPLQLSLDLRPEIFVGSIGDDLDIDLGVSFRYLF